MNEIFYPWTTLGVLAVVAAYAYALVKVGRARHAHDVKVPETTGPEPFVRAFRAHQNSVEQMVVFLPLVAVLASLYGDYIGAAYAFVFAIGRFLFVRGYNIAAEKRTLGFTIGLFASLLALLASVVGVIVQLVT